MFKTLPIGVANFEMLITRGNYFADKTMLIKDLLDKKGSGNLFTRPRHKDAEHEHAAILL